MIGKYPKCYNRYKIIIKLKNVINKHKSNKIKENSNTVRHLNNGTDHRHSKSCCDQSSPARRTMINGSGRTIRSRKNNVFQASSGKHRIIYLFLFITVWPHFDIINFPPNNYKKHPISHQWNWKSIIEINVRHVLYQYWCHAACNNMLWDLSVPITT